MFLPLRIQIDYDVLLGTSMVFTIFTICILLFIAVYLVFFIRRKRIIAHLVRLYSDMISAVILCDSDEECSGVMELPYVQKILRRWIHKPFARELLLSMLVSTRRSLAGRAAQNLDWLYVKLGLLEDSLRKLSARKYYIKAKGLQELAEMQQHGSITRIYRETNNRNRSIRNVAQLSVVQLTGNKGLRFLNVISNPLSQWQQVCLIDRLPAGEPVSEEQLSDWLRSSNESVVEFALRLARHYRKQLSPAALEPMLAHQRPAVREQAGILIHESAY